ncbi:hypothetical protein GCM10010195_24480 [Kitasatospora griseola]|nr:hypothetical protein GCM10010195_24480 [Kitasatospora griseola]
MSGERREGSGSLGAAGRVPTPRDGLDGAVRSLREPRGRPAAAPTRTRHRGRRGRHWDGRRRVRGGMTRGGEHGGRYGSPTRGLQLPAELRVDIERATARAAPMVHPPGAYVGRLRTPGSRPTRFCAPGARDRLSRAPQPPPDPPPGA